MQSLSWSLATVGVMTASPETNPGSDVGASPRPLPQDELDAAEAIGRLGRALLSRSVDPALAARIAAEAAALADEVEATGDVQTKAEAFTRYTGHQRVEHFITTGEWPPGPPDGEEVLFDVLSFVGGRLNPFSAGAVFHRDGDEAVARLQFSRCFEGPPDRAHGGIVAAVFDEVMGSVFRVLGIASAFTGSLSVRFEAGAPLATDVEFRARLASHEGRKFTVEAEATGPDGQFASASAVFIEMRHEQLISAVHNGR